MSRRALDDTMSNIRRWCLGASEQSAAKPTAAVVVFATKLDTANRKGFLHDRSTRIGYVVLIFY